MIMKFRKIYSLFCLAILACITQCCEPDFDINARNRDITVAYGLLDIRDSIHYVKVYKGFQSSGNPLSDAAQMENLYYFDKIEVALEEYDDKGNLMQVVTLDTTTQIPRRDGVFSAPTQLLYTNREYLFLDPNATYKLKIRNKETGKITEGRTEIVDHFSIRYPYAMAPMNLTAKEAEIQFDAANNAAAYQVTFKFHYLEKNRVTGNVVRKTLERDLTASGFVIANGTTGKYSKKFSPRDLYNQLLNELEVDNSVIRYKDGYQCVEIEVWAGGKDWVRYLNVNKPSTSLVQDRLELTNLSSPQDVDSGFVTSYGLISSRTMQERFFDMDNRSEDTLVVSSRMKALGFDYYRNFEQ